MSVIEGKVDAFATRSKLPAATTSKLKIVLDELISNIINYGYADDAEHEIEICLELVGHRLVVTIADDGVPFNPLTVKPPDTSAPLSEREIGGLGIHLVRNLVDEISYRRRVDKNTIAFIMLNDVRTKKAVE
jgi:sigma-B regulation protein RsbU (phosphoserine phosphatase)